MSVVSVWHATTADVLDDDARRARALGLALARGPPASRAVPIPGGPRHVPSRPRDGPRARRTGARRGAARLGMARGTARPARNCRSGGRRACLLQHRAQRGPRRVRDFQRRHRRRGRGASSASSGRCPHGPSILRAVRSGRHRTPGAVRLAGSVPQVLDAQRGVPEGTRGGHRRSLVRSQFHARRRCDSPGAAQLALGRR